MQDLIYGRVQLCFHLDDPVERGAYNRICSEPSRGKTKFVANCIAALKNESDTAELIADMVVKRLMEEKMIIPHVNPPAQTKTPTGKKRGRPRKHLTERTDTEKNVPVEATAQMEKKSEGMYPDNAALINNEPSNGFMNQPQESEISFLDDEMLRSMESFITG